MAEFREKDIETHANILAQFYPNDVLFGGKAIDGTVFRNVLKGYARLYAKADDFILQYLDQYNLLTTDNFITEWESAVGIPDACFPGTGTMEERRLHVQLKLLANGTQTEQDFIDLGALLGKTITIEHVPPSALNIPPYDVPFTPGVLEESLLFYWTVKGDGIVPLIPPFDVPFSLDVTTAVTLTCFFNTLKPAMTIIIFENN